MKEYDFRWQVSRSHPGEFEFILLREELDEQGYTKAQYVLGRKGEIKLTEGEDVPDIAIFSAHVNALPSKKDLRLRNLDFSKNPLAFNA